MNKTIFTIGYEGLTPEKFDEILRLNKIDLLFDIRDNPYSKKEGFTKSDLARRLENCGIEYIHLKQLGCPRWLREDTQRTKNYQNYFEKYAEILQRQLDTLDLIISQAKTKRVCLMCMEKRFDRCHRKAVAEKITAIASDIEHLELRH